MKLVRYLIPIALGAGLAMAPSANAATASAQMLANTCAGCHGPDGASHGPATPTIAGLSVQYFIDAMKEYREGKRPATVMGRIAKGYDDEEIKLMANYFGKKKFVRLSQKFDKKSADSGAKLHKTYCSKCHEENGRSAEDDTGVLAGQWTPYLTYTMKDFLDGKREMGKKMKAKVTKMNEKYGDKGFQDVIQFYASQQ